MLDVLRRNAGSWVIKIILLFIALTFIWWGVGTYSEEDRNVAATVGEDTISMTELADMTANLEKTYREMYGSAFTPEIAQALGMKKQAMDTLIQRRILVAEAGKMGILATDDEVQQEIAATPAFQANGQFREELYRQLLSSNRLTPQDFEGAKRTEIAIRKLEGLLSAGALVPETKAKDLFLVSARKIRVLVAAADPEKTKDAPQPAESEIAAKYEQVKESFRIPARVKVAVAAFSPDRFGRDIHPSEEEVKAYYEGNSRPVPHRGTAAGLPDRPPLHRRRTRTRSGRRPRRSSSKRRKEGRSSRPPRRNCPPGKTGEEWITRKEVGPELSDVLFSAPWTRSSGPWTCGEPTSWRT